MKDENETYDSDDGLETEISSVVAPSGVVPPDGGWGWVVVCSVFLVHLTVDGTYYVFGILLPEFVETFQCSEATASWVGSLQVALAHVLGLLCIQYRGDFQERNIWFNTRNTFQLND